MPREESPPPSPPSPDQDTKLSRKREREVSLEPITTPTKSTETDAPREHRDTRTPAKKNRTIELDPTEEEDDGASGSRSGSGSPVLPISPPQEMKIRVRQISQGVEDLSWRNIKPPLPGNDIDIEASVSPPVEIYEDVKEGEQPHEDEKQVVVASDALIDVANGEATDILVISNTQDSLVPCTDAESGEKGLKRKFLERGTSQGPPDSGDMSQGSTEPLKRPRDDVEEDDNPRETKRPSPPPEPKSPKSPKKAPSTITPKLSGFMAYASTSSPFAAVRGLNLFSKNTASPSPLPPTVNRAPALSSPSIPSRTPQIQSTTLSAPPAMRFGFEAFASPSSPFLSVAPSQPPLLGSTSKLGRAKSPSRRGQSVHPNAFSPYASNVHSFVIPLSKRVRADSPSNSSRSSLERTRSTNAVGANGSGFDSGPEDDDKEDDRPISFGEKLRAGKDDEDDSKSDDEQAKVLLTEQDVLTGEEDDETIHQVRGKLFSLVGGTQWKERGSGTLKINVRRSDGSGARLVMRKEAVYTLLLNVTLFHGMRCSLAQDPRYLRFSVLENGTATHYNLKLASTKIAQELLEEINANIPTL